jgi:hypothetical protein
LPLYIARLQALEAEKGGDRNLKTIIDTADTVIKSIDTTELLEYYGLKFDARPDATKIKTYDVNFAAQKVNFKIFLLLQENGQTEDLFTGSFGQKRFGAL